MNRSWNESNVLSTTLLGTYRLGQVETADGIRWFVLLSTEDYAEPEESELFDSKRDAWMFAQLREATELGPFLAVVRALVASKALVRV